MVIGKAYTGFFLECVRDSAENDVATAQRLFALQNKDHQRLVNTPSATVSAIRFFDALQKQPFITSACVMKLLKTTKPTAAKAIAALLDAKILKETTGKQRDRVYPYQGYLKILTSEDE